MNDAQNDTTTGSTHEPAGEALLARSAQAPRRLEIRFTGSGSEYFRIWAVNLLLILLSAGLYLPFAKMRRIRYLYANTLIDGEALAFHGDVWKMFRGFVLLAALMLIYSLAGKFSPTAALLSFGLLCAIWPALWRASMQFRLANSSWRGMRMGFDGSLRGAYLAHLPLYLPAAMLAAIEHIYPADKSPLATQLTFGALALGLLLLPLAITLMKRYQHQHYRLAGEHSRIDLWGRSVYFIGVKTVMFGLGMLVAAILLAVVVGSLVSLGATGKIDGKGNGVYYALALLGLSYVFCASVVLPYHATRVQNLVWNHTHSASLSFRSQLTGLSGLTLANWGLILLTLGLYRPFAVIATTRLRLQAISVTTTVDAADWVAPAAQQRQDATGDVAGDFFGLDVGL